MYMVYSFLPLEVEAQKSEWGRRVRGKETHFRRGTKNLRCSFRRLFGRNRKSRGDEGEVRRNYPEAVLNGKGQKWGMYGNTSREFGKRS